MWSWLSVFAVAAVLAGSSANAANIFEKLFYMPGPRYDAVLPLCQEPTALDKIKKNFGTKESRFWNSELKIMEFRDIREIGGAPRPEGGIPRRFCSGQALISDGIWRHVDYSIVEDGAMIGWTWGVEWCVVGVDRNWAYAPGCKMARP